MQLRLLWLAVVMLLAACQTERDQIGTTLSGAAPGIRYSTPAGDGTAPMLNTGWVGIDKWQGRMQDRYLAAQLTKQAGYPLFQIHRLSIKRWYLTPGDGGAQKPDPSKHDLIAQLNYMRVLPLKSITGHLPIGGRISTVYSVQTALTDPGRRVDMLVKKCSSDRPLC